MPGMRHLTITSSQCISCNCADTPIRSASEWGELRRHRQLLPLHAHQQESRKRLGALGRSACQKVVILSDLNKPTTSLPQDVVQGGKKPLECLDHSSVGIREAAMLCHLFVSARAFPYVICHRFTQLSGTLDFGGKETQRWTEMQTRETEKQGGAEGRKERKRHGWKK